MSLISYRPEIDGLRALAVLPVILFHLGFNWIPGGYIGVDVFFVISGFLITSIIIKEYDLGKFSFSNFWLRRIRRILPVLIAVVLVTLFLGKSLLYAPDIYYLGKQGIASLLSFANISQWLTAGDYWGFAAENSLLLHTWSLSVEEQFYLVFPVLAILLLKYLRRWLALIIVIFSILSAILFIYGSKNHPDATFYLLPTRAWELGSGAFLAILVNKNASKIQGNQYLSSIGFIAVVLSYFLIDGSGGISPYLVIPVIGAAFIILFSQGTDSFIKKGLSLSPVVYIGKISYSLYLWHWPVLVLSRNLTLRTNVEYSVYVLLALIFTLSIISYHLIEVPTRRNTKSAPYILLFLLVGVIYSYTLTSSTQSEDISMYSKTGWDGELYNVSPNKITLDSVKRKNEGIIVRNNENKNWKAYEEGGIIKKYGKNTPEIVVLGDSHALMWSSVLDQIAAQLGKSISFYAADGTPTFFDIPVHKTGRTIYFNAEEKQAYDEARLTFLGKWKPEIVIISQSWLNLESVESTQDLIKFLGNIGSKVFIIEQPPELFFGDKNATQFISYYGLEPSKGLRQYVPYLNSSLFKKGRKAVRTIVDNCKHCELIPITDIYLKNKKGWVLDEYDVLYIDEDHLSNAGALKAKDRILRALTSKAQKERKFSNKNSKN